MVLYLLLMIFECALFMYFSYIHIGLWITIQKVGLFYTLRRYDRKYINSDRLNDWCEMRERFWLQTSHCGFYTFLNSVATAVWWYLFLYRGGQTQKNDRSCIFDSKCNQGDQISHSQRNHVLRTHDCIISYYTQIYSHVTIERYWPL